MTEQPECPHFQTTETEVCPGAFGCYDIMNKLKEVAGTEKVKIEAALACSTEKLTGGILN